MYGSLIFWLTAGTRKISVKVFAVDVIQMSFADPLNFFPTWVENLTGFGNYMHIFHIFQGR
jgi:hypothetical protein